MSFELPKKSTITEKIRSKAFSEMNSCMELDSVNGMADFYSQLLKNMNIEVNYSAENDPEFLENRKRLNTEPGLVIANHPSVIDGPLILKNIRRSDIKIVVKPELVEQSQDLESLRKILIPARKDSDGALQTMQEILDHINSGGLVLLFPTGGKEIDVKEGKFSSGFRFLISKMKSTDLVYAFNIDLGDNEHIKSKQQANTALSVAAVSGTALPFSDFQETSHVTIDEKLTTADEWQKLCTEKIPNKEKNQILAQHYREMFGV